METPHVAYRVGLGERARHLYEIEARFPTLGRSEIDLKLPVWSPGSYLVREYERHVQEVSCSDGGGRALAWRKVDKATWRVATDGADTLVARYRVYAHELTVRTSHLDHTHAFWNGTCLFLYDEALRQHAIRLALADVPDGWHAATGLDSIDGAWVAPDYDTLVDAPFEVGPHERIELVAAGRPHEIAVWGRTTADDRARLAADVTKIVDTHAAFFGGAPYGRYTFILHLVPGAHGGLEHANSSTLLETPHAFGNQNKYHDLLELVSHEHFHAWNVKRLHPEALAPRFDYSREAYTRSLWVVEGWTSYYDRLALRRAGLLPAARYLEKLGEELSRLAGIPGRLRHSLEESSFDAWIKLYRPDENTVNSTVSYYLKGSIVALLLDLEIRRRTNGARSLDDAMRALWQRHGAVGRSYSDAAVHPLVEEATGLDLGEFWDRFVRGREELDLTPLASVGLRTKQGDDEKKPWLGVTLSQAADRLNVSESLDGGPAQSGGLYPGDQIIAWEGWRVDKASIEERLSARRPGDTVRLTVFRRDELREVTVALGERPAQKIEIEPLPDAPAEAKAAYQAWLGEEWKAE